MWIDKRSEFADEVEITFGAGTNLIGHVMDTGSPNRDLGQGHPLYLVISVAVAFAGGTSMQFILASDASSSIAGDGSETRHYASDVFTTAQLTAGFKMVIPLPMGDTARGEDNAGYERFLGILGVGLGTHTAGKINAFLTPDPSGWVAAPDGNN